MEILFYIQESSMSNGDVDSRGDHTQSDQSDNKDKDSSEEKENIDKAKKIVAELSSEPESMYCTESKMYRDRFSDVGDKGTCCTLGLSRGAILRS